VVAVTRITKSAPLMPVEIALDVPHAADQLGAQFAGGVAERCRADEIERIVEAAGDGVDLAEVEGVGADLEVEDLVGSAAEVEAAV
jgi:hypothetical protein